MKFFYMILVAAVAVLFASCSTSANVVGSGKVLRLGGDGMTYVNGLFAFTRTSAEAETAIVTDDGDSIANPRAALSGVREIRFRAGQTAEGWKSLKTSAKRGGVPELPPAEPLKQGEDLGEAFVCNGKSCSYSDLSAHTEVTYLRTITDTLLQYDGNKKMQETGETYKETLQHFSTMLDTYEHFGEKTSKVAILRATVENGVIEDLMYCAWDSEGGIYEVQCPNCAMWEPEGYTGE